MAVKTNESKRFADSALRSYLLACDSTREQARAQGAACGGISLAEAHQRARHAWSALQRARIFAVEPAFYAKMWRHADVYTTETIAGLKWYGPDATMSPGPTPTMDQELSRLDQLPPDQTDPEHLLVAIVESGRDIAFPAPLPFDAAYLSYGQVGISLDHVGARIGTAGLNFLLERGYHQFVLNGHLLWGEGDKNFAYTFISGQRKEDPTKWHCMLVRAYDGEWDHPYDLDPWTLPAMINAINSHRSIQDTPWTPGQRFERKQHEDPRYPLPLPKPYYLVQLADEVAESSFRRHVKTLQRAKEFSHRWDVRGHECVRVLRGAFPMDVGIRERLTDRRYRIYGDGESLSPEHELLLAKRVASKKSGEWMAVLVYWRGPHVKGPTGKPYIPAMRTGIGEER